MRLSKNKNQQRIVNVMPRWDKKKGIKKTKQQEKVMKVIDTCEGEKLKTPFIAHCIGGKMPVNSTESSNGY